MNTDLKFPPSYSFVLKYMSLSCLACRPFFPFVSSFVKVKINETLQIFN